jgi:uncharacterized membrane protein
MEKLRLSDLSVNVDKTERAQSLITGASFLLSGINNIKHSPKVSIAKSILGGYLLFRGITGHCYLSQMGGKTMARVF